MPSYDFRLDSPIVESYVHTRVVDYDKSIEGLPAIENLKSTPNVSLPAQTTSEAFISLNSVPLGEIINKSKDSTALAVKFNLIKNKAPQNIYNQLHINIKTLVANNDYLNSNNTYKESIYLQVFSTYDFCISSGFFTLGDFVKNISLTKKTYKIIATKSNLEYAVGQDTLNYVNTVIFNQSIQAAQVYIVGKDSTDSNSKGLDTNESFKVFLDNGETYQEISLSNPPAFQPLGFYEFNNVTVGNRIDNI